MAIATQTFTTSGSWAAPANLVPGSVQVQAWGPGGTGGTSAVTLHSGGGAGGGATAGEPALGGITPGSTTLTVTIGAAGSGNPTTVTGGSVTVSANAGQNASGSTQGNGGAAGSNTQAFAGGAGQAGTNGSNRPGGGGGSSAGTAAAGNPGSGTSGGTAPSGGGNGGNASAGNGSAPGGGGAGAGNTSTASGGNGGGGQVIITWSVFSNSTADVASVTGIIAASKKVAGSVKGVASAVGAPLPVRAVNQWAATFAQPGTFGPTPPALQSTVIALTPSTSVGGGSGTPGSGNWLFLVCGWNQAGLPGVAAGGADDIHSFWRPGDVTISNWASSPVTGSTRAMVWYTANLARTAADVYAAPSGAVAGMAALVVEIAGLGPWDTVTGIDAAYSAAATTLGLSLGAPSAAAFTIACVCGDSSAVSQAFAPAGWTTLATVTASNGADHTCDAVLTSAILPSTTGSLSVSGTSSGSDLSGVMLQVQVAGASPLTGAGVAPAWPGRMIYEAALGGGFQTPADQLVWTVLSDSASPQGTIRRAWSWNDRGGVPYSLGQLQSGSGSCQLDNADGYLTPSNSASPLYSNALNANWDFEAGTAPWTGSGGLALTQSAAFAVTGTHSMLGTPNGSSSPAASSELVPVFPGVAYSATVQAYVPTGWASGVKAAISWYTSGSTFISTTSGSAVPVPAAAETQATLPGAVAPATAAYGRMVVQVQGSPASSVLFYLDDAAMVRGTSAVLETGLVSTGTPVRVRVALGTMGGQVLNRWYCVSRNMLSFEEKRTAASYRNYVEAGLTDIWSVVAATCPTPVRGELAQDSPYAFWPCDDGLLTGGLLPRSLDNAAAGNSTQMAIIPSPLGVSQSASYGTDGFNFTTFAAPTGASFSPGVATYAQPALQGWDYGDPQSSPGSAPTGNPVTASPGAAAWQMSGGAGDTGANGWYLAANDPSFPPVAGGVTVEIWFNYLYFGTGNSSNQGGVHVFAGQPYCNLTTWTMTTGSAPVAMLQLDRDTGNLSLITFNGGSSTSHSVYTASDLRGESWHMATVRLTQSSYAVDVDGGATASVSGSATISASAWSWLVVNGDMGSSGGGSSSSIVHGGNAAFSRIAVYAGFLPAWRVRADYWASLTGFGLIPPPGAAQIQILQPGSSSAPPFTPDGAADSGSYGTVAFAASTFAFACVQAAVAGSYHSGPSPWAVQAGIGTPSTGDAVYVSWTGVAPTFAAYTSAQVDGETLAAVVSGSSDTWIANYGASASALGPGQVSGGTGAAPPTSASALGDTVAQRLERCMGYGGLTWPGRAVDSSANLPVQAAIDVGGQQLGGNLQNLIDSDNGMMFTDGPGILNYRSRPHMNSDPVVWQLSSAGLQYGIPFAADQAFSTDQQRIYNVIQLAPYSPDGSSPPVITPSDAAAAEASQMQAGPQPRQVTSYLQSTAEIQAAADWTLAAFGTGQRRITKLTVDAAQYPAAWPLVLGCSVSDVVQVTDLPLQGGPMSVGTYRVSNLNRTISFGANGNQVTASLTIVADPIPNGGFWS